jgi:hypothetical protein
MGRFYSMGFDKGVANRIVFAKRQYGQDSGERRRELCANARLAAWRIARKPPR